MASGPSTLILKFYFSYSELCFTAHKVCLKSAGPVLSSPVPATRFFVSMRRRKRYQPSASLQVEIPFLRSRNVPAGAWKTPFSS